MKALVTTLFVLTIPIVFFAQNTLPLLGSDDAAPRAKREPMGESEKFKIAREVYRKLVEARGDYRYPEPKFTMIRTPTEGATMNYDSLEITLEEKAYDVCASFGDQRDAALAIILGHELMHYYEKHGWRRSFAKSYQQLNIGIKLGGVVDDVTHETQADYLGGFLAYSAGFGLFDQSPELIQRMYKAYGLKDTLSKYATRQEREAMSSLTIKKLELLVDAFEVGNLLAASGNFEEARLYYQYVLRDYQSREIYNNIGVTTLLQVLKEDGGRWFYPVELDLKSRAGRGDGWGSGSNKRSMLLQMAIKNFEAAISMDAGYAPAYLNKACAYALLGDWTRARFYAETEAMQRTVNAAGTANNTIQYPKTAHDVNILMGIVAYNTGDSVKARQLFESESKNSHLAAENLRTLLRIPEEEAGMSMAIGGKTDIDSISLASFSAQERIPMDKGKSQVISPTIKLHQYSAGKESKIYICEKEADNDTGYTAWYFHITKPRYSGKTAKGIGIGAKREELISAYKTPVRTLETPKGEILVYKRMMFILEEGKLMQWVNYLLP